MEPEIGKFYQFIDGEQVYLDYFYVTNIENGRVNGVMVIGHREGAFENFYFLETEMQNQNLLQ